MRKKTTSLALATLISAMLLTGCSDTASTTTTTTTAEIVSETEATTETTTEAPSVKEITADETANYLDIYDFNYTNSSKGSGGLSIGQDTYISIYATFKNKSSDKTIKSISFKEKLCNSGKKNGIGKDYLCDLTLDYKKEINPNAKADAYCWDDVYKYNNMNSVNTGYDSYVDLYYIEITYTDGSSVIMKDDAAAAAVVAWRK